ncbi:MAG: hypothetical protein U1E76_10145 [Planctomycetota bacterium]
MALAGLLRFHKLGQWSVWGDEIYTFDAAQEWLDGKLSSSFITMPLAYLLTPVSMVIFGKPVTEFEIRFFPALLGSFVGALFCSSIASSAPAQR